MSDLRPMTDGLIVVRAPAPGDARTLIAGRDETFRRWLGVGDEKPDPSGCILVAGKIVGWVDYEIGHDWLRPGEANVGYDVFAPYRGNGYASRGVQLLMHHLAMRTDHRVATLLIHPLNQRSLAVAARTRFAPCGEIHGSRCFKRRVPPLDVHRRRGDDPPSARRGS
jgi:RimJ/RimL family protein N-acetyltransferase